MQLMSVPKYKQHWQGNMFRCFHTMKYSDCGLLGWSKWVTVHVFLCQLGPNSFNSGDGGNMLLHNTSINLQHYKVPKLSWQQDQNTCTFYCACHHPICYIFKGYTRIEVLIKVTMKITHLLKLEVEINQQFTETCSLHLHGTRWRKYVS